MSVSSHRETRALKVTAQVRTEEGLTWDQMEKLTGQICPSGSLGKLPVWTRAAFPALFSTIALTSHRHATHTAHTALVISVRVFFKPNITRPYIYIWSSWESETQDSIRSWYSKFSLKPTTCDSTFLPLKTERVEQQHPGASKSFLLTLSTYASNTYLYLLTTAWRGLPVS